MSWVDHLPDEVYKRLSNCRSTKSDLETLVNVKWASMVEAGKKEKGFIKEDALVSVLELLDSNGQCFNLSEDEYNELKHDPFTKPEKTRNKSYQSIVR